MTDSTVTEHKAPKDSGDTGDGWSRLSKEEINVRPIRKYTGPIHLIRDSEQVAQAVRHLEQETVLGFDTEARPTFRSGEVHRPTVLQLAGEHAAYVFQLQHCRLARPLRRVLSNPKIIKAGVAPDRDIEELNQLAPFRAAGFVDVGALARQAGCKNHGLRGMAAALLNVRVSKSSQRSNWAKETLSPEQIEYAATDAWIGRELYHRLQQLLA
jgi:ribonuclease D